MDEAAAELLAQISNTSSALFAGNVTVAVDPTWGLSGDGGVPREYSPYLPHQVCTTTRVMIKNNYKLVGFVEASSTPAEILTLCRRGSDVGGRCRLFLPYQV